MELKYSALFILCVVGSACGELCPKKCDCDMDDGLNRATCNNQNIVNVDVGVPKSVQMYSLSHNAITELENFCFKDIGYTSLKILILSYNLIFWIGLHAFNSLGELVELDLSYNRLRDIPSDLFWDTPHLDILDLSGNVFETLKNEPFIIHDKLQVLNLQNCRIKSFPERIFKRLPNLKKLDLSENYVISFKSVVLQPLTKLTRLELKNDYLKCSAEFIVTEAWIVSRDISYVKLCKKSKPKMFEKIISAVVENDPVDVNDVWNITEIRKKDENVTIPVVVTRAPTLFEKFDKDFPAFQALLMGLVIGLGVGIVGTYLWLSEVCKCKCNLKTRMRRQRRITQRISRDEDMSTNLLWYSAVNPDLATPPQIRRELSLPDGSTSVRTRVAVDAVRFPDRCETPPPPYNECRINVIHIRDNQSVAYN
ncbi:vasorin [Achroia grisella]|uniref:vasorin n=1 Tax=Achroia grisella TaxID=688607 RepID=UPI0027D2ACFE|nr:vasorin [Achroia grisella]